MHTGPTHRSSAASSELQRRLRKLFILFKLTGVLSIGWRAVPIVSPSSPPSSDLSVSVQCLVAIGINPVCHRFVVLCLCHLFFNMSTLGLVSLGGWLSGDAAKNAEHIRRAVDDTATRVLKPPNCVSQSRSKTNLPNGDAPTISDLPIAELKQTKSRIAIDVITDVQKDFDMNIVEALHKTRKWNSLPGVLAPRNATEAVFTMELALVAKLDADGKEVEGTVHIVKIFYFEEPVHIDWIKANLIRGVAHQPCWIKATQITTKVLHYLVERLPGNLYLFNQWKEDAPRGSQCRQAKHLMDDKAKRNAGYDFIEQRGPKTNN